MATLSIKGVRKSFGAVEVLNNIDIELEDGGFLVLLGPSGCGKSTLLSIIAGLEPSSGGDVFIGERNVNNVHPKDRNIAMVFQSYALYPTMSVKRNIGFGLEMRKVPEDAREEGFGGRRSSCRSSICSSASPASFRAGSASAWPWAAPLCATRTYSCSTSRSATSMPSCASRCAPRSSACTTGWAPPPSTSRTTRSRR